MRFIGPALGLVSAGVLAAGCSTSFTCDETRTCERPTDGGEPRSDVATPSIDSGPPDVDTTPPRGDAADGGSDCDDRRTPDVEPCLVDDARAVFVAAGATEGNGSKAAPFATIGAGIAAASTRGVRRVIVCNATYPEAIALQTTNAGIGIFGGFTCPGDGGAGWAYEPGRRPLVRPDDGAALRVTAATGVTIQDVDFEALFAREPGASSIAAVLVGAGVTLRRVAVESGAGAAGASGSPGVSGKAGAGPTAQQDGESWSCSSSVTVPGGVSAAPSACGSRGGNGGQALRGASGSAGAQGTPGDIANGGTAASVAGASFPGGAGKAGTPGTAGDPGAAAAAAGTFTQDGFTPADGAAGTDGATGQGGGGGGASKGLDQCTGASGGAGGQGGCGGTHGTGGGGGGASVAIFSWDSVLTLVDARLTSGVGGDGGAGGTSGVGGGGAAGGKGGEANVPQGIGPGGAGGAGGPGGHGGAGAGGSGGPSFALVFHGTAPAVEGSTTLDAVSGGRRGPGGTVTGMATTGLAPAGAVGGSAPTYEQK